MKTFEAKELNELAGIIIKLEDQLRRMHLNGTDDVIADRLHEELEGVRLIDHIEQHVSIIKYEAVNRLNQLEIQK